jgi:hypothetical protein
VGHALSLTGWATRLRSAIASVESTYDSLSTRDSTQQTLILESRVFFIQTHSHGTFLWILRPVSVTLAGQFTQTPGI